MSSELLSQLGQLIGEVLRSAPNGASIEQLVERLRQDERIEQRVLQINAGDSSGYLTQVNDGGTANVGIHLHNFDAEKLEQVLKLFWKSYLLKPTPNNLPRSGVKEFVGRTQKLQNLHEQLQSNQRIAITAIAGMGGMGKTELALQYAISQREQDQYPGGFCWLRARGQEIATQIVTYAQTKLALTLPDGLNEKGQVDYCWGQWREGDVLIVIDDVTDFGAVEPYLPPSDPRFKVLITTRLNLGSSVQSIFLEELDDESSLALLETLVDQERIRSQLEGAKLLCEWVGNLPLGLELLGRYLANDHDLSIHHLLQEMESMRLDTEALVEKEDGMTAQLGIAETLELSWNNLKELEKELAYLLALFAIAPIPWQHVESCLLDTPSRELVKARNQGLLKRNLLKRAGPGLYQLHQIVQEFFRVKLHERSDDGKLLKSSFCKAMVNVAQGIEYSPTIDVIKEVRVIIPHLEEVINQWSQCLTGDDLIWPFEGIGRFYEGQGNYGLALPWRKKCLEQVKLRLDNKHPDISSSLNNLAVLYKNQGWYKEAEPLYTQALQMRQRLLGKEHPDVATSLNNLAELYDKQGRYKEAEPLYTQALQMRQGLLGKEHPDVATSLNNLALLYDHQGRYKEAESHYLQALEMTQNLLGIEHPDVATTLNDLAALYLDQGRYEETESLYIKTLEMRQRLLGEEHPDIAQSIDNLALLYDHQGRYKEAEPLYLQALAMRQKLLGNEHPDVVSNLNNLALLYDHLGRYEEAEPLYIQNLAIYQKIFNEEHPNIATSLNNLAALYYKQERYTEAEPLFTQALEMTQKLLGNEHPDVAQSLNNLAALYNHLGRYEEAEPLYLQALEMRQNLLGNEHPDIVFSLNQLSLLYNRQKRYKEAESRYIQALQMRQRLLGEEHPDVATSLNNLADLYGKQGRYEEAEPLYTQALLMRQKLLGMEHPDVAQNLNNLAELYRNQGRYEEAKSYLNQALKIVEVALGPEHPSTQLVRNNLDSLL